MLSQKGKDNLMVKGDNNVVFVNSCVDVDYSKSKCKKRVYGFVPLHIHLLLVLQFIVIFLLFPVLELYGKVDDRFFIVILLSFAFLLSARRLLTTRYKKYKIVFIPKEGKLIFDEREILFRDVFKMIRVGDRLTLYFNNGEKPLVLTFRDAVDVSSCIGSLWRGR